MFLQSLLRTSSSGLSKLPSCVCLGNSSHRAFIAPYSVGKNCAWTSQTAAIEKRKFTSPSARTFDYQHPAVQFQPHNNFSVTSTKGKESRIKAFHVRLQEAPAPAFYLGFAGLTPFVLPALFCLGSLSYSPLLAIMQVTYGATILSFLGGIHWGYSLHNKASPSNWRNLGYSVTPPLIAWVGLLMTPEFGTLMLMAGLSFAWRWDMKVKSTPSWFRALRVCLSVGALLSLGLTYTLGLLYPPPDTSTTYNWVKLMKIIKIILED